MRNRTGRQRLSVRAYLRRAAGVEIVRCPDRGVMPKDTVMQLRTRMDGFSSMGEPRLARYVIMRHSQAKALTLDLNLQATLLHELGHAALSWRRLSPNRLSHFREEIMASFVGYLLYGQILQAKPRHMIVNAINNLPNAARDHGMWPHAWLVLMQTWVVADLAIRRAAWSDSVAFQAGMAAWGALWTAVLLWMWHDMDAKVRRAQMEGREFRSFRFDGWW